MELNSWVDLKEKCPIDLGRIHRYAREFESKVLIHITINNLNKSKTILLDARGDLDNMFSSLIQLLYDQNILNEKEDKIVFHWLAEDFARYLKNLDEKENDLIIKFDEPKESRIGVSRLSSYTKTLKIASDSVIYECLFKASDEYNHLTDEKKEIRTFFYILFQILQVTLSVLGGQQRQPGLSRKKMLSSPVADWRTLMGEKGQDMIGKAYNEEADEKDLDLLRDLKSLDTEEEEEEDEV